MDYGHSETDKELKKLESRVEKEYKRAELDMRRKSKDYLEKFKAKDKIKKQQLKEGKITKQEYNQWRIGQVAIGERWKEMQDVLYKDLSNAKEIARSMINGFTPEVYALNHNYGTFEVENGSLMNTSYTLYDRDSVYLLIRDRPDLLPNFNESQKQIAKEERWSKTQLTSAITQGILQGESIDGIAKRLSNVANMEKSQAIRSARTMTTSAENLGRKHSYDRALSMGIKVENQWVATQDSRTRDSHRMMDGEIRKINDEFSNGLLYPGDPSGDPSEVYNCRCTLIAVVDGVDYQELTDEYGVVLEKSEKLGDMDYEEWKYEHQTDEDKYKYLLNEAKYHKGTLQDKTYSGIWKDDVTLSDYSSKKDSIQGKRDYYSEEIDKLKNDPTYKPWLSEGMKRIRIDEYSQYLKDLEEFEREGKKFEKYQNQINEYSKKLKELKGGSTGSFDTEAYSEERKKAAKNFDYRDDADKYLRPILDKRWEELTEYEKYSLWQYTHNSHPMNQGLSGYNDGWTRREFVGVGNADWGIQDNYGNRRFSTDEFARQFGKNGTYQPDYTRTIAELTKAIDGSEFADSDMWLVRRSDNNGLAGLIEGELFSFNDSSSIIGSGNEQAMRDAFVGQTFQMHSFCSTGMAKDAHWSGNVYYRIYAPEGTKGIYSEPASYFGGTTGMQERIYSVGDRSSYVGSEAEIVLQRGTQFRITDIKYDYGDITVTMEIVGQPDYFVTGMEETFNGGATLHIN